MSNVRAARPTLTALVFAVPVAAYLWFIHQYAVNVIVGDQWQNIGILSRSYGGSLGLGTLWSPLNENRMFFPNLLMLLLARTTNLNVVVEAYLGAFFLMGGIALLILAHRRRSKQLSWLVYLPVAVLLLSFVQYESTLFGLQVAWFMAFAALGAAIFLVDRPVLSPLTLACGIAVAVVGSYSSFEGLFIWPAGLVLLWLRRRPWQPILAWVLAAVATCIPYFWGLSLNAYAQQLNTAVVVHRPLYTIEFFLAAIGDVIGVTLPRSGFTWVMLVGVVILGVALFSLVRCFRHRQDEDGRAIGAALICVGLFFAAFVAGGRVIFGLQSAGASRFTTFDLLFVVGSYLALLKPAGALEAAPADAEQLADEPAAEPAEQPKEGSTAPAGRNGRWVAGILAGLLAVVVGLQIGFGVPNGLAGGRATHTSGVDASDVMVNIGKAPDWLVKGDLDLFLPASSLRQMVAVARTHRLSIFDTSAVAFYAKQGLDVGLFFNPFPAS